MRRGLITFCLTPFFFAEMWSEIEESLTEINNCMTLLMPDSFSLFSPELSVDRAASSCVDPDRDSSDTDEQPCCSKDLSNEGDGRMEEVKNEEMKEVPSESVEDHVKADMFIRSTGLMSHNYRLDLDVSLGWLLLVIQVFKYFFN